MSDLIKFTAIGKIPGECIFVHKQDLRHMGNSETRGIIKCIAIDFESKTVSDAVSINDLLNVSPHDPITSLGEREVIEDLVRDLLSEEQIEELNLRFEQARYQE